MRANIKSANLCLAALALASVPMAAAAQQANASAAASDASVGNGVDEIIVTARKRSESVQDVPVSVSAFNAAALRRQQVTNVEDLSLAVPSVLITQTGGSATAAQIFIRGFGQDALGFNSETPVGVYFDDVFLGRAQGSLLDILDIDRIEILRGPQGTLYGRNSTTGAVKFVVRAPDLDTPRGIAEVTIGSFDRVDVRGALSIPIIEGKLAAKLDFVSRNSEGYLLGVDINGVQNGLETNGPNRDVLRGALLWKASETVTVDITADLTRDRSGAITGTPILCVAGANSACTPRFGGDAFLAGINYPGQQEADSWGVAARITVDLGWGELKSITAYRGQDGLDPIDLSSVPGAPTPIIYGQSQEQFSQELQVVSSLDGRFNFAAGLFYFREDWATDTNFVNIRRNIDEQSSNSYAAYGEVYVGLVDKLTLTLGGRVTRDTKSIDRQVFSPRTAAVPTVEITPPGYAETVFTPKVAIDWKPSDDLLFYGSYSQGYRPGGYGNTWPGNAIAAAGQFEAEKVSSYEVGAKTSWADNRITFNLAAYRSSYDNLQQAQLTPTQFVITSSDARVQGLELEAAIRPIDGLLFYGNVGLLDDKITRSNIPGDNLSRRLRYAPRATFKIGGEYRAELGESVGSMIFGASLAGVGATPQDQANSLSLFMPAYQLLDAQISYEAPSGRYRVTLGGKNLTDTIYWRSGVPGASRFYAPPRNWSLSVSSRF